MDVLALGPLRVRKIVKTSGTTSKNDRKAAAGPLVVVLMHGYGAPGDDLVSLAGAIDAPAGTTFLFPEAPSLLFDDARAWWPIDVGRFQRAMMRGTLDEVMRDVPDGLQGVRDDVVGMLDALEQQTKGARVVLGGFSQGSMLALDVTLRTKRPLAGVVVMSGTLIAAAEWLPLMTARKDLPVFQSHGKDDPILPYVIAERLRSAMDDAGMRVSFRSFEGGHGIPPTVMRDLGEWLHSVL